MKPSLFTAVLLASIPVLAKSPPARQLAVRVVNATATPARAVEGVRLSLVRSVAGTPVTAGVTRSDRNGRALFDVPLSFLYAYDVRLELIDAGELVIYEPGEGSVDTRALQGRALTLKLLPRGSPALLEPVQLEALIARLSSTEARAPAKEDLTRSLRQWAQKTGFTIEQVESQLRQWVDATRRNSAAATKRQLALAEFADQKFLAAAELFGEVAEAQSFELERAMQARKEADEAERAALVEILATRLRQSMAYRRALRYEDARKVVEAAVARIDRSRHRELWLDLMLNQAMTRREDAEVRPSSAERERLLELAMADYQSMLEELKNDQHPLYVHGAAIVRRDMGTVLVRRAEERNDAEGVRLLAQGIESFRTALQELTRAKHPRLWAETQTNLGVALSHMADRSTTDADATRWLTESAHAYHASLEVFTRAEADAWAMSQEGLAITLRKQSVHTAEPQASTMLGEAIDRLRAALSAWDRKAWPREWARTQGNLANTLGDFAARRGKAEAVALLKEAVAARQAAIELYASSQVPYDWAITQSSLGLTLIALGERTEGVVADGYLKEAHEAYRLAMLVFTREAIPLYWGGLQARDAHVFVLQAERAANNDEAAALRRSAIDAYRRSIEVHTREALPLEWSTTQAVMGDILAELARKSDAKEAGRYWAEAMTAYHAASQVLTRERSPERWATLQYTRGKALIEQANRAGAEDPKACASEALVAYEGAQLVYTRAAAPNQYAGTQYGIAQAHLVRGDRIAAADATDVALELVPESIQSLRIAERLFQDHLFAFERAFELNERRVQLEGDALVRLDFAEKHLTTARFAGCVAHLAPIDVEARVVPVRESIRFACEFAMGNKEAAAMSSNALLELAAGLQKPGWVFAGTLHFIASHDAFAASRASWTQLFEKLEAGDGNGLAAAVREIRKTLVP